MRREWIVQGKSDAEGKNKQKKRVKKEGTAEEKESLRVGRKGINGVMGQDTEDRNRRASPGGLWRLLHLKARRRCDGSNRRKSKNKNKRGGKKNGSMRKTIRASKSLAKRSTRNTWIPEESKMVATLGRVGEEAKKKNPEQDIPVIKGHVPALRSKPGHWANYAE